MVSDLEVMYANKGTKILIGNVFYSHRVCNIFTDLSNCPTLVVVKQPTWLLLDRGAGYQFGPVLVDARRASDYKNTRPFIQTEVKQFGIYYEVYQKLKTINYPVVYKRPNIGLLVYPDETVIGVPKLAYVFDHKYFLTLFNIPKNALKKNKLNND